MVSKWMPNGNINEFLGARRDVNRFELVSFLVLIRVVVVPLTIRCVLQLEDVAEGLAYMHGQEMVHGDLKGVRFTVSCSLTISNWHRKGKHPYRRKLPCMSCGLRPPEDHIGNHKPRTTFKFIHTGWDVPVDESRTLTTREVWPPTLPPDESLGLLRAWNGVL